MLSSKTYSGTGAPKTLLLLFCHLTRIFGAGERVRRRSICVQRERETCCYSLLDVSVAVITITSRNSWLNGNHDVTLPVMFKHINRFNNN